MAKIESRLYGDFDQILADLHDAVHTSISASLEGRSDLTVEDCRCAVRIYERYSALGGNRLTLNITLLQKKNQIYLIAVTAGGSSAMFFKVNTFGEESFLKTIQDVVQKYGV